MNIICEVVEQKECDQEFLSFQEKKTGNWYRVPRYQLKDINLEEGKEYLFRKKLYKKTTHLELVREDIELPILRDEKVISKSGRSIKVFVVQYEEKEYQVAALPWQNNKAWNHETLICSLRRYNREGDPIFGNKDFRHSFMKVGQKYDFQLLEVKKKKTSQGILEILIVKGDDNNLYEVKTLKNQRGKDNLSKVIRCKVLEISYNIKLVQIEDNDDFFVTVSKIVNDEELVRKYFFATLENFTNDKDVLKLKEQYKEQSSFWVFTFANKVLPKKFFEAIKRFDYESAMEINFLIKSFEEWILKRGIISSISNESLKNRTLKKAKKQLERCTFKEEILLYINKNPYGVLSYFPENGEVDLERFYYILSFSSPKLINDNYLFKILVRLQKQNSFEQANYYTKKLQRLFDFQKRIFLNDLEIESFNLITRKLTSKEVSANIRYLNWSYFEFLMEVELGEQEAANVLASQIIRGLSLKEFSPERKKRMLYNSFNFLDRYQEDVSYPFYFEENVSLNVENLVSNDEKVQSQSLAWKEIETSSMESSSLTVNLRFKTKWGYEMEYKGCKGFLPLHHISDKKLKNYKLEECDFSTNVICSSFDATFNFFMAEQLPIYDDNYFLRNNAFSSVAVGHVLSGKIKGIEPYGLFIATQSGEGLLHISEMFDFEWMQDDIEDYFDVGQTIRVVVQAIDEENRFTFNFTSFKLIDPTYYNEFVHQIFNDSDDDFFEQKNQISSSFQEKIQYEKALCLEQLAIYQSDLNQKLNCFRLAQQLFSNIGHARSYLINIYTAYFEILLKLNQYIQKRKSEDFLVIQAEAKRVEDEINTKTVEVFPDSQKLLIFLRIIQLWNKQTSEAMEELYQYIKKYDSSPNNSSLRTVSKITMSNNLMVSEVEENEEYVLRNLRLIYHFLINGVLSLREDDNDRYHRELQEKINYLKKKIAGDESEILEFKSSIFKPYPKNEDRKKLEILKKQKNKSSNVLKEIDRIEGKLARKAIIHSALKNICAFANTNGGTLLIGINDDKEIIGIEGEYEELLGKKKNRDGYGLAFDELIRTYFGRAFSSLLKREIIDFPEGGVLVVEVKRSLSEVFLYRDEEGKPTEELYIRNYSSAEPLTGKSLAEFIKNKHIEQLRKNFSHDQI